MSSDRLWFAHGGTTQLLTDEMLLALLGWFESMLAMSGPARSSASD